MRFILGFLSGVMGLLAGWFGLAALVIEVSGPDRDGGLAMGAFFDIGPIGGLIGFVAGVLLFIKKGMVSQAASPPDAKRPGAVPAPARTRLSPTFAVAVLVLAGGLGWWGWYELIRSPYLTHGFMALELQFRLAPGMALIDQDNIGRRTRLETRPQSVRLGAYFEDPRLRLYEIGTLVECPFGVPEAD